MKVQIEHNNISSSGGEFDATVKEVAEMCVADFFGDSSLKIINPPKRDIEVVLRYYRVMINKDGSYLINNIL